MFYVLIFSLLAVVLVVVVVVGMTRRRQAGARVESHPTQAHTLAHTQDSRRTRNANRAQSQHDRRKRH
jgi:hypothetical protein